MTLNKLYLPLTWFTNKATPTTVNFASWLKKQFSIGTFNAALTTKGVNTTNIMDFDFSQLELVTAATATAANTASTTAVGKPFLWKVSGVTGKTLLIKE